MKLKSYHIMIHHNMFNGNNVLTCHKEYLPYQFNGQLMYGSIFKVQYWK